MSPRIGTPLLALALTAGCETDALYTYCTTDAQCGSRSYQDGEDEIEVFLACVEATIEVSPERTTVGNFCTLDCFSDADCDSRIGLGDGYCVTLEGDEASFCYQRCGAERPCYPSSRCETLRVDGELLDACVPTRLPE